MLAFEGAISHCILLRYFVISSDRAQPTSTSLTLFQQNRAMQSWVERYS